MYVLVLVTGLSRCATPPLQVLSRGAVFLRIVGTRPTNTVLWDSRQIQISICSFPNKSQGGTKGESIARGHAGATTCEGPRRVQQSRSQSTHGDDATPTHGAHTRTGGQQPTADVRGRGRAGEGKGFFQQQASGRLPPDTMRGEAHAQNIPSGRTAPLYQRSQSEGLLTSTEGKPGTGELHRYTHTDTQHGESTKVGRVTATPDPHPWTRPARHRVRKRQTVTGTRPRPFARGSTPNVTQSDDKPS